MGCFGTDLEATVDLGAAALDLALTATVANMFDRMPPKAQEELGYDPFMGNPLGRTFEVGIKKSF